MEFFDRQDLALNLFVGIDRCTHYLRILGERGVTDDRSLKYGIRGENGNFIDVTTETTFAQLHTADQFSSQNSY